MSASLTKDVCGKAIYNAAGTVADEIRKRLKENLDSPEYVGKGAGQSKSPYNHPTGALYDSLGITPMKDDGTGYFNVKVGFDGYDSRGIPNQLKARAMESGTSTLRARPFVKPAMKAVTKPAVALMKKTVDEEIEKIMKG